VQHVPKPLYQIKAYGADYQMIQRILEQNELSNFSRPLNVSAQITFRKLQVQANFVFRQFNFIGFRAQSAKKHVCILPYSIAVKS